MIAEVEKNNDRFGFNGEKYHGIINGECTNMTDEIRVIIFGAAGDQGLRLTRYCIEKGAAIVAAVGNKNHIGEDIGTLAGIEPLGVPLISCIELDLDAYLEETKPNLACFLTWNLQDIADEVRSCLKHRCNVTSIAGSL